MYLDPAFGGMLLQIAVALFATGAVVLFSVRRKIKAFFNKDQKTQIKSKNDTNKDIIDELDES